MFRACGTNVYATNIAAIDLPHYSDSLAETLAITSQEPGSRDISKIAISFPI